MGDKIRYPVGRGWWPLADEAVERLGRMNVRVRAVYEKYGTLRLDVEPEPNKATDILLEIEEHSAHVCERCGRPGNEVENSQGWVKTLCRECAAEWRQNLLSIRP